METGREQVIYRGPHMDIAASRDGRAVLFCYAASHSDQSVFILSLAQTANDDLPHAAGEPARLTDGKGLWHAHHGSWPPDGKAVFYGGIHVRTACVDGEAPGIAVADYVMAHALRPFRPDRYQVFNRLKRFDNDICVGKCFSCPGVWRAAYPHIRFQ